MIEANHDLRNPTDMILLERSRSRLPHRRNRRGSVDHASVGTPLDTRRSRPDQRGNSGRSRTCPSAGRAADLLNQVNVIDKSIDVLRSSMRCNNSPAPSRRAGPGISTHGRHDQGPARQDCQLRRLLRPLRNYFYWEPHCSTSRSARAAVGLRRARRIDALTEQLATSRQASPNWTRCSRNCWR